MDGNLALNYVSENRKKKTNKTKQHDEEEARNLAWISSKAQSVNIGKNQKDSSNQRFHTCITLTTPITTFVIFVSHQLLIFPQDPQQNKKYKN